MPSIKLFETFIFPNILPEIKLTSADIAYQAKHVGYKSEKKTNDSAEGKYPIEMVPVFYRFVTREQRIPTQEEFKRVAKMEMMMNGFDLDCQNEYYKTELISRLIYRTYPSLIRDIHFCKFLQETLQNYYDVLYNPALDLNGIDILMIPKYPNAYLYGICLYLNTPKGVKALIKKRQYRKEYCSVKYIELPKDLPANMGTDDIWLYDNQDVNRLMQLIGPAR